MSFLILAQATEAAAGGGIMDTAREVGVAFGFNWQLLLSQIISFCLMAVLLQKFAYKPILKVLAERRAMIQQSLENSEKIKSQLAEADAKYRELLAKAGAEAQRIVDEARTSAATLAEKRSQQAIAEAESIITKAREATVMERDRTMAELKREVGRLVVETTAKVAGKVITPDDQKRLTEEAARQMAA